MSVFSNHDFDNHERVVYACDKQSGLQAIIAIHNTNLGPSLGGCRMFPYADEQAALSDVLRLSRGMTYKSALAGVALGGGKTVIIGNPATAKSNELFCAMGRIVHGLSGQYIVAQDSGISIEDLRLMATQTEHVAIVEPRLGDHGELRDGNPSPATAYGIFVGIQAAVKHRLNSDNLAGVKIAIQGVGNVGFRLAEHLHNAGAELLVSDLNPENCHRAVQQLGATAVSNAEIASLDVDVYSPCALGGAINSHSIDVIKAPIIAGAANNQLAKPEYGIQLQNKNILYAPDYAINAGGVIDCYYLRHNLPDAKMKAHLDLIGNTLSDIFLRAEAENKPTSEIADLMAEERFLT